MSKSAVNKHKVALIYDRANTPYGGAEKVLLALHQIFPDAPLYTSIYNPKQAKWAKVFKIVPSFLQLIPFAKNNHRLLVGLMPLAFESFDLSSFDIIISITSAEAKGVITRADQLHVCYLLTPTRYLYSHQQDYLKFKKLLSLPGVHYWSKKLIQYLKWWDQTAANRPDVIIPISKLVADRCKKYYQRKTEPVIYPPIENKKNSQSLPLSRTYYLVISRLVAYKRINLAIKACIKLNKQLVIVGDGPEKRKLKDLAKNYPQLITFTGNLPKQAIQKLYNRSTALLMPGEEDFGITALEANAHGKPVIINQKSGAAELIKNRIHGIHIETESVESLNKAIKSVDKTQFDPQTLRQNAIKYDTNKFTLKFKQATTHLWQQHLQHKL